MSLQDTRALQIMMSLVKVLAALLVLGVLGATVTLPELYAAAGGRFAFDAETLGDAVSLIERTLGDLAA